MSIRAKITEFDLSGIPASGDIAIIPTVKGSVFLRYGKHAYYFHDFAARKCVCVEISHRDIIVPGLAVFLVHHKSSVLSVLKQPVMRWRTLRRIQGEIRHNSLRSAFGTYSVFSLSPASLSTRGIYQFPKGNWFF